ncbi:MAG: cytochrome b/b6 domain-containing protein [Alphaproteobacteria bacterium]|nr:cytochrome b/b6 domain-containing protein [Alphaproteobacteria bacterium]
MSTTRGRRAIHPWPIRLTHWINAAAMLVMIASGWQIYNAYPILPFVFPSWMTLGGWLGGALLWHFAAMWVLAANFLVYLFYGAVSGRFRATLWPIRPGELACDLCAALNGRLPHDAMRYNAIQKLLYAGVIAAIVVVIMSGVAIWKPVQFQGLTALMGGFQGARLVHFLAMAAITGFLILHVVMAVLVPRTLLAMLRGR